MNLKKKFAGVAFAAGLAVTGVTAGTVATAAPAEAVPYKLPAGYWGGTVQYRDVHGYWHGDDQVRCRYHTRMYWDGSRWYEAVYYNGCYYSGATRA